VISGQDMSKATRTAASTKAPQKALTATSSLKLSACMCLSYRNHAVPAIPRLGETVTRSSTTTWKGATDEQFHRP
jgi:hypothetical protein